MTQDALKQKILAEFLKNSRFEGWTEASFRKTVKAEVVGEFAVSRVFPGGLRELTGYYIEDLNECHKAVFKALNVSGLKVRQQVELAVIERIKLLNKDKEATRALASYLANPFHADMLAFSVGSAASLIWELLVDNSTDFSYHTKRFSLGAIYSKTVLFWLSDDSIDFAETREFLKRQIDALMEFGKFISKFKNKVRA